MKKRQSDNLTFSEHISDYMMKNEPKIQTIVTNIKPFEGDGDPNSLDDILIH